MFNISRAALTVATFTSGDFSRLSVAMDGPIHQSYRFPPVPGLSHVMSACYEAGASAAFLSGAGPIGGCGYPQSGYLLKNITLGPDWTVIALEPDAEGAVCESLEEA